MYHFKRAPAYPAECTFSNLSRVRFLNLATQQRSEIQFTNRAQGESAASDRVRQFD
jgi:hypothetical protein